MEPRHPIRPAVPSACCVCGEQCTARRVLTDGRQALHRLAQAVAVIVGAVELLPLHPAGSPKHAALEQELMGAIDTLIERTEHLRDVLAQVE
ncbi:MAG: hypothetical protein IRZ14_07720 [Chloroflexi bacterium]|nr:hypothetical protein [Chloroflexota bacterium]